MSGPMFSGSITALITPFRDGRLDEEAFQRFVEWQIEEGTSALVSCGTTGESPTLSHEEDMRVTALCIEAAKGRVPVIAGDRKSVVEGKRVSVRVDLGGRRLIKKNKNRIIY